MKRFTTILTVLALAVPVLTGGPARAEESCALNGLEPLPITETAKDFMLKGDYRGFFFQTPNPFPKTDEFFEKALGPLVIAAPKGFDSCSTIMRRTEAGGMVQELILFGGVNKSGNKGEIMSLFLVTGPVNGETALLYFVFNSQFENILEQIR